ncbi:MAG: hypothetical protein Q9204_002010 [Flavoplaca sp. TL-2023a]
MADGTYSTVSSGIWLNVELSVGILSVSLPLMRPLVSRAIPSQTRTRFTKSHTGTHRLQDVEGLNGRARAPHSQGLSESGIYQGQSKRQQKSWYNTGTHVTGRHSEEGSEEDMVPMGKIQVRHELEWEREREVGSVSQKSATSDTLR